MAAGVLLDRKWGALASEARCSGATWNRLTSVGQNKTSSPILLQSSVCRERVKEKSTNFELVEGEEGKV